MPSILDRLIGTFSPDAALRRHRSRELLKRAYEGASQRDGWRPKRAGASANADHAMDARALRARSRALEQNVPYIAQGMRAHSANIIGTGITPRWLGDEDKEHNAAWMEWGPYADADGRVDINGLILLAYHTSQRDGEVLVRLRPRRPTDGLPIPLQLQVLEIDWLDDSRTGVIDGLTVISGIAYTALGKVFGYYLFDQHPGEILPNGRRSTSRLVLADNIIHFFAPSRPGQGRGFPRVAPVIARTRDLMLYEDAELHRKNLETRLSVIGSGDVGALDGGTGDGLAFQGDSRSLGELPSGGLIQVPTGVQLTVVKPDAAPGYVEYLKMSLHLIAAGAGWTYEMMTGDVRETNFSSARIRQHDYRREAEQEQWLHVIPGLIAPIVRAAANAAELAGRVRKASYNVRYATPKWPYVNPKDDVRSDLDEVFGGLSSFSEKMRARGYEPSEVYAELQTDIQTMREMGILDVLMLLQKGRVADEPGSDAGSGPTPPPKK